MLPRLRPGGIHEQGDQDSLDQGLIQVVQSLTQVGFGLLIMTEILST